MLGLVARSIGLRARRVCRALRDAYGGLQVSVSNQDLMDISVTDHTRLMNAATLELRNSPWNLASSMSLGLIAHACPSLESLSLLISSGASDAQNITDGDLATLAPLASTLTALLIKPEGPSRLESIQALQQLSRLRSLQLHCVEPVVHSEPPAPGTVPEEQYLAESRRLRVEAAGSTLQRQAAWLEALSGMHQLVHLSLFDNPLGFCARGWLPGLARAAPQLTSLRLGSATTWDEQATAALLEGLPSLQAFSAVINPMDWLEESPQAASSGAAVVAALARRSGLQSLELAVHYGSEGAAAALSQLPALQLSALAAYCYNTVEYSEPVARVLAAQSGLTRLLLRGWSTPRDLLSAPAVAALACTLLELRALGPCDPAALMACVAQLPRVRVLELAAGRQFRPEWVWTPEAVALLGTLTQLQRLSIEEHRLPAQLLPALSGLTRLTSLQLAEAMDGAAPWEAPDPPTLRGADLACLVPLRARLARLALHDVHGLEGAELGWVRHLSTLKELELVRLPDALEDELHLHLLPPPPVLTCLRVLGRRPLLEGVREALQRGLGPQQCALYATCRRD
jgi:hypothetical protein